MKDVVYCAAIENGGIEEWKFAWQQYQEANVAAEKTRLLYALGCTKEPWIQSRCVRLALMYTIILRMGRVGANFDGRSLSPSHQVKISTNILCRAGARTTSALVEGSFWCRRLNSVYAPAHFKPKNFYC